MGSPIRDKVTAIQEQKEKILKTVSTVVEAVEGIAEKVITHTHKHTIYEITAEPQN